MGNVATAIRGCARSRAAVGTGQDEGVQGTDLRERGFRKPVVCVYGGVKDVCWRKAVRRTYQDART